MARTADQIQAELDRVRAAIQAALTGKRYRIQDGQTERELERQSLPQLQARESYLEAQLSRLERGGSARYGVVVG